MKRLAVAWALALLCAGAGAQHAGQPVSMVFVGDVMLDDTPGRVVRSGRDPFAHVAHWLRDADVRVANLESVVATTGTPEPDKPYTFRAHPRVMVPLRRHFDAVGLANNHAGDYGPEALMQTLALLDRHGIGHFGAGADLARAHAPLIIERNGLRIALLGYNEFFPRSFEADVDRPGIAWSEDAQVRHDIALARSRHGADLVIPVMHWGWEYEPLARPRQRALARLMIEAGADAVVGGHPHVTQDTETYQGKPIIYSLGNFVFDGFDDEANNTGWLLHMVLNRQGVTQWRTHVARIDKEGTPHPARQHKGSCWQRGWEKAQACE